MSETENKEVTLTVRAFTVRTQTSVSGMVFEHQSTTTVYLSPGQRQRNLQSLVRCSESVMYKEYSDHRSLSDNNRFPGTAVNLTMQNAF